MPESCSSCGEPMAPAARIVSRFASAYSGCPSRENSMPSACRFTVRTLETSAPVSTLRFLRCSAGRRKRSEEHTSELQSHHDLVCRLLLEKKNKKKKKNNT